ncbi:sensor histidine kinase [Ornithinibacillus halotolerans]|uniref:Two-component sensor histidine kinase n=1 Tax=Ornithinibacillus halotolerans TaxID=1274357 RepID=A0A916SAP4_9BACI|nr:sensor histidine kinase [Ornithinibacillus halotolerans]GGA91975.1 two-component sensor histidine kinase [Ornithinibacillus halotolerans]
MKLRNKVFMTFAILVLVPLSIITFVVYGIFSTSKLEDVTRNTENTIVQLNNSLDLMIDDAARSTLSVLYNKQLIQILTEYSNASQEGFISNEDKNTFSLFLSGIMYKREAFHGVHVFSTKGHTFSHMERGSISEYINLSEQPWYQAVKDADGSWILYPESKQSYYRKNSNNYVSFIRLLKDPDDLQEIGIIKVDFSPNYLEKLTEQMPGKDWQIFSDGRALFSKSSKRLLDKCTSNHTWVNNGNQEYFCITHTSLSSGIQINNVIPKDYLYQDIKEFGQSLILVIILSLVGTVILSFYVSKYLLKPFELLKNRIRDFHNNKINQIDDNFTGEFAELSGTYNNMLSEINQLVEEVYELNTKNAESEYKTLQSKMDPHFIFNTLESINMTALIKKQFDISDMVSELGSLIRYRLNNEDTFIPLQAEINFSKSYIALLKYRLGEKLHVQWDIASDVTTFLIPKYLIQPLIENAVKHGFMDKPLSIHVTVKVEGKVLEISVQDNGRGIPEEKRVKIQENLSTLESNKLSSVQSENGNGLALVNISRRLMLIYGSNYHLQVHSIPFTNTIIKAKIPVQRGDLYEENNDRRR